MAGLQRSAVSFRRQGSSGLVWEDKFLNELTQMAANQKQEAENKSEQQDPQEVKQEPQLATSQPPPPPKNSSSRTTGLTIERSRSNGGGRGYRTGRVSPAIEPPSPKVSACGFCGAFAKNDKGHRRPPKSGKRKM